MQKHPDKIFWWVFGTHATAIFLLLIIPLIKGCFHPRPKEIVSFVEFVSEAPAAAQPVAEPQPVSRPEPVAKQPVVEPPKP
ncbi:MAG: hypothetical protein JEZ10_06175, partial [Verrucomicrobia bacterium]|nr:hypothetical protein [Verrucomicrobiota bacterium]